jgi:hypothetical protein
MTAGSKKPSAAGAEPVARDMSVGVEAPTGPGTVLAIGAAGGPVACVSGFAVIAFTPAQRVTGQRSMPVSPPSAVRLGSAECVRVGQREKPRRRRFGRCGEQQVVCAKASLLDVAGDACDYWGAELETPELGVLRVWRDQEPATLRMELRVKLDDGAADRQDPSREVEIPGSQFGKLAPAQAALYGDRLTVV